MGRCHALRALQTLDNLMTLSTVPLAQASAAPHLCTRCQHTAQPPGLVTPATAGACFRRARRRRPALTLAACAPTLGPAAASATGGITTQSAAPAAASRGAAVAATATALTTPRRAWRRARGPRGDEPRCATGGCAPAGFAGAEHRLAQAGGCKVAPVNDRSNACGRHCSGLLTRLQGLGAVHLATLLGGGPQGAGARRRRPLPGWLPSAATHQAHTRAPRGRAPASLPAERAACFRLYLGRRPHSTPSPHRSRPAQLKAAAAADRARVQSPPSGAASRVIDRFRTLVSGTM